MPIVCPGRAWDHHHIIEGYRLISDDGSTVLINLTRCPILLSKWCGGQELTVRGVKHIEKAVFWRLHYNAAGFVVRAQWQVRQQHLLGRRVIPLIARRCLIVPPVLACISVERQN